ncbi:hypothetical protein SynBIOSE41_02799 [Synechococcus sp. BIOS-E4-1]|nr:hypothetical protein SynBIOSE41_02799 [Synechococcus sp. BIOS-E4-1]
MPLEIDLLQPFQYSWCSDPSAYLLAESPFIHVLASYDEQ